MASIRLRTKKILTDLCDIERLSSSRDAYNQPTGARSVVASDVPCRLLPSSGGRRGQQKDVTVGAFTVFLMPAAKQSPPADWTVSEHDWLDIAGKKYEILNVTDPLLDGLPIELAVERVKP